MVKSMLAENTVVSDLFAAVVCCGVQLMILLFCDESFKRGLDMKLVRKFGHISFGLGFMLCWPLFSSGNQGLILAATISSLNIIILLIRVRQMMSEDEASMSRIADRREFIGCNKFYYAAIYYASANTLACLLYWRTSPIAVAAICNLSAGDGIAGIVGRRFGRQKLPYNPNKSIVGSVAMATAGFISSVGFMHYFANFGYIQGSLEMVLGFLVVSVASALVESLPLVPQLDDNLTVPLTSMFVGTIVF
ncbi:Phosphatidate cytidylyltransferase [Corchorus olitorius]|uniref:Phosphatidate cytidylyltransferase n=1 Tax=Corchorus olitorius TaxID=93759 RepID=A0A1R3K5X5_9ROSI|nr:Phosphatidate cytidylyltransferase [Corchorus olitorius]